MPDIRCQSVTCNLCQSNVCKHLFTAHLFRVVKCLNCGLVYLNPMPCPEDITKIYDTNEYYSATESHDGLTLGYPNYAMLKDHLRFVADELLHPVKHVRPGRLLDVGCGMGFMLSRFREQGWDTYGVDVSTYATEYARNHLGLKVFTGTVNELDLPEGCFDMVTMVLTIEHVPSPKGILESIHHLMKPGAILIVTTHDIGGLWPRIIKGKWRHLNAPEHLYFFTKNTLKRLLENTGFHTFRVTETATIASATSDGTGLYTPVRLLHRHGLIRQVAPLLRGLHAIARTLNLSDGVTTYSQRV